MARVVLGLSGGVDSAASAVLLQRIGYEVYAVWMDNGSGNPEKARECARLLGIHFDIADMREGFECEVIRPFINSYLNGKTPNPCIDCNPKVKFKTLFEYAEKTGADAVATGHYAKTENGALYTGSGPNDQSYMLYRLPSEWLRRIIFPLGGFISKDEVRSVAGELLPSYSRESASMEICFIPEGAHWQYIESRGYKPPPGDFIDDAGRVLGCHEGIHRYTVGMRRHLGIALGERMYVKNINPESNHITLSPVQESINRIVELHNTHWFTLPAYDTVYRARNRHSRRMGTARLIKTDGDRYFIEVSPECGIPAPGQSTVLYDGEKVMGGGIIYNIE